MNTPFKYKVTITPIVDCQTPEIYGEQLATAEEVVAAQADLFETGENGIVDFLQHAQIELTVVCEVLK